MTMPLAKLLSGLKRLGLTSEVQKTKDSRWLRVFAYLDRGPNQIKLSVTRFSIYYREYYSHRCVYDPLDYYHYAIPLMIDKNIILNHINLFSLGVRAYNSCYQLNDGSKRGTLEFNRVFSKRLFDLFRNRYYGENREIHEERPKTASRFSKQRL